MFRKLIVSHTLRRRVSWMIAAVLILPFIIFFHATGRAPLRGPGGLAGELFGKRIPWDTFQLEQRWVARQWESQFGTVPESLHPMLAQTTWDRLILLEEARRRRVRVDDRSLADFIRSIPAFQERGRFQSERYHRFLQATNASPQAFENLVRHDLLIRRLLDGVKAGVSVTDADVRRAYVASHEALRATLFFFDPAAFQAQAAAGVTDDDIRAEYNAHPEAVRVPEQLVLEYTGASRESLRPQLENPAKDELQAYYDEHREEFAKDDGGVPPFDAIRDAVRQHVVDHELQKRLTLLGLDLQDDLDAGLRVEEIVAARHLVMRTVGPFAAQSRRMPNELEPAVLDAVVKLPTGQLSDLIKTDEGVYLARVTERIPARMPPLDEVRERLRQTMVDRRTREAAQRTAEECRHALADRMAAGYRFEEAVLNTEGLSPRPAQFTRTQPIDPLGHTPSVNEAAFATPIGQLTEVLDTSAGFAFLHPEAHLPADESRFTEVAESLRRQTLTQKQSERLDEWIRELRTRAKLRSFLDTSASSS